MKFSGVVQWTRSRRPSFWALLVVFCLAVLNGLYWFAYSDRLISLVMSGLTLIAFLAVILLYGRFLSGNSDKSLIFLIVLICSGLLYMIVFPPLTAPDETYHFESSYCLSNVLMGFGYGTEPMPMRMADEGLLRELTIDVGVGNYSTVFAGFAELFAGSDMVMADIGRSFSIGTNPPWIKLPSALGITVARLLNLGPYYLLYLGRLCNLLVFVAAAWWAYRITPIGKNVLATVSLLPMTLHLAASYSYDAGILALAFLDTALILRAIRREGPIRLPELLSVGVTSCLLAPCKVVYYPLVLLVVFIPGRRFASRRHEVLIKASFIVLPLVVLLGLRLENLVDISGMTDTSDVVGPVRGDEAGLHYTLGDVLSNPVKFILMYLRTFDVMGTNYLFNIVGTALACLQQNIVAPYFYGVALMAILLLSSFKSIDDGECMGIPFRMCSVAVFIVCVLAVMASMLLDWTSVTDTVINGVQGRYFLPLLPLLLVALRTSKVTIGADTSMMLMGSISAINMIYMVRTFSLALTLP